MRFSEPPGSQLPPSQPPNSQIPLHIPTYRPATPLSRQILDSCDTALAEDVWPTAFSLLKNVLVAGTGTVVPACVPPPSYMALAATVALHPSLTTRTLTPEDHEASNIALDYLRHVNNIVGPRAGNFTTAFRFADRRAVMTGRGSRSRPRKSDITEETTLDGPETLYANEKSLFNNVDDFWHVVGWAFNCSVAYRHRWERWRLWLDFMLDVLDRDITICATSETVSFNSCLLHEYLRAFGEGRDNKRKLLRAIFADGKDQALAEFSEIWKEEPRFPPPPKTYDFGANRRKLDLEAGEYGDYYDETDEEKDEVDPSSNRSTSRRGRKSGGGEAKDGSDRDPAPTSNHATAIDAFGGLDSILLRQRFLALLMRYCVLNPDSYLGLEGLCDLYTEFLRPLRLAVFQQFVLPSTRYLTVNDEVTLDQTLLRPLLENAAPKYDEDAVTQRVFIQQFAPFAANSSGVVDNARVSLLVEDILRLLLKFRKLKKSERLTEAVERGIEARKSKAEFDGRKKSGTKAKEGEEAFAILQCSADRMRACVEMVE